MPFTAPMPATIPAPPPPGLAPPPPPPPPPPPLRAEADAAPVGGAIGARSASGSSWGSPPPPSPPHAAEQGVYAHTPYGAAQGTRYEDAVSHSESSGRSASDTTPPGDWTPAVACLPAPPPTLPSTLPGTPVMVWADEDSDGELLPLPSPADAAAPAPPPPPPGAPGCSDWTIDICTQGVVPPTPPQQDAGLPLVPYSAPGTAGCGFAPDYAGGDAMLCPAPPPPPCGAVSAHTQPRVAGGADWFIVVQFKYGRAADFMSSCPLPIGCHAIVEGDRGEDLGMVIECSLRREMEARKKPKSRPRCRVLRRASIEEGEYWRVQLAEEETAAKKVVHDILRRRQVPMRVLHAEFQFDLKKLTFHFTSTEPHPRFKEALAECYAIWKCRIWFARYTRVAMDSHCREQLSRADDVGDGAPAPPQQSPQRRRRRGGAKRGGGGDAPPRADPTGAPSAGDGAWGQWGVDPVPVP